MRHRNAGRKLGRDTGHRKALFRNLVTSLLENERIQTTDAKAKQIRRVAEKLITLARRSDLHARRQALAYIRKRSVVTKLFSEISPRYMTRPGGYTRIIKVGNRKGDNAPLSILELVEQTYVRSAKTARPKAEAEIPAART